MLKLLVSTCLVAPRNWFGFCSSQRTALWSLVSSEGSSSDYIQQTGPAKMLAYTATGMAALLLRQVAVLRSYAGQLTGFHYLYHTQGGYIGSSLQLRG